MTSTAEKAEVLSRKNMSIKTFTAADIYFSYCHSATVPEIPYVQDVLYVLRLSEEQRYYDFCVNNHATYVVNVGLVIAAIGYDVLCMERYDESETRKIIAQAILNLTRLEDQCLFNPALIEASETVTGMQAPSRTADREKIIAACGCTDCRRIGHDSRHNQTSAMHYM